MAVYKTGAELADPPSALTYGTGRTQLLHAELPGDMPRGERLFWAVLGWVSDIELPRGQRKTAIDEAVHTFGADAVTRGLSQYGVAGGVTQSSIKGVPGRDIYTAFAAELNLRAEYSIGYGAGMPPPGTPDPEMSARELFDDETIMMEGAGLGRLYMFVPATVPGDNTYTRVLSRGEIISNILPDDTIIVRCGPIAHVAVVYKLNLNQDEIWLTDPLYEYWQPSHNACMSKYGLIDGPDNGYLVVVSAKEVEATLQGVITQRADLSTK